MQPIDIPHHENAEVVIKPVPFHVIITARAQGKQWAYQVGHRLDYPEAVEDALKKGFTRKEWIDFQKDPSLYRFEHYSYNARHIGDIPLEKIAERPDLD